MTAVLSLNGKPQATLRCVDGEYAIEEQPAVKRAGGSSNNNNNSSSAVGAATQQVMQVLGSLARIKISDGRIVLGQLHCFDKHQNVILTDAREFPPLFGPEKPKSKHSSSSAAGESPAAAAAALTSEEEDAAFEKHRASATSRSLGMTLVPGKHIVYIKVHK